MGASTPTSRVVHYRIRTDTGTVDGTPTWAAAEDTAGSVTVGTAFRIRMSVENTGTASDTITAPVASGVNDGILRVSGVTEASFAQYDQVINGADAGSSADATDVTTQRLTSGAGSFATGTAGYDENETLSCAVAAGAFTEVEFGVVLTGGPSTIGVGGGETWTFCPGGLTTVAAQVPSFTTPHTNGSDFTHGNQLGQQVQASANATTITLTTTAAASSGNLVVAVVTCDNNGTTDGDLSEISGVTIGGVAATKAVEYTNGQGTAQAGVTVSIWYLQLASNLASSSSIVATFTTNTTSGDKNTIWAREYTVASGKTVSVEATNGQATDAATQPTSLNATTSNIECLRLCAHSCEGGGLGDGGNAVRASNSSWSLWWTAAVGLRAQTGSTATDVCSIVEATISTGTGSASQIGAITSAADWASAYVAFRADAGANFEDGDLSATGTGTASLVGASTAVATASATGTGTATLVSSADDTKPFSMTGTGTATLVGASQADSTFAATGTGTATFVGASSSDASLAATGTGDAAFISSADDTKPFSMTGTGTATFTGASQADSVLSATGTGTADFVGLEVVTQAPFSMTGTGTATLVGASYADAILSATGTGTATWAATSTADSPFSMTGTGTALFVGASQSDSLLSATGTGTASLVGGPLSDGVLSATGTATVAFASPANGDGALAATGTVTASFVGDYDAFNCGLVLNDGTSFILLNDASSVVLLNDDSCLAPPSPYTTAVLSATGTGTAAFVGESTADSILAATGTVTVSWSYASEGDGALTATGTGTASLIGASDADSVLAATGTGTADFVGEGVAGATDAVFDATGTGTALFVGVDATPVVVTPPALTGGGVGTWSGARKKKRKKKDALDELDELLVVVSEQIAPWSAAKAYEAEQALYRDVLERGKKLDESNTLARIEAEIVNLKELLAEIDDEEALLLLM
jgi:hypothetical protein